MILGSGDGGGGLVLSALDSTKPFGSGVERGRHSASVLRHNRWGLRGGRRLARQVRGRDLLTGNILERSGSS